MTKTKFVLCILICSLIFVVLLCACGFFTPESEYKKYTVNIEDYNSSEYPLTPIFPKQIPQNVTVEGFSYYEFYHEDFDKYIELSFETEEDLEKYIEDFLVVSKNELINNGYKAYSTEWFKVEQNPHNNSYTDVFFTCFHVWQGDDHFTGYEVSDDHIETNGMGILSYSYKDLVAIHSYSSGSFTSENDYIPQYVKRFCIDLTQEYSRIVYFMKTGD